MAGNANTTGKNKRSNADSPSKGTSSKGQIQWINPYLNQVDLEWLEGHYNNVAEVLLGFYDRIPMDYTLSQKYDHYSERYQATLICNALDDPNFGIAISVRGATMLDACFALAYCVLEKLPQDWSEIKAGRAGRFG